MFEVNYKGQVITVYSTETDAKTGRLYFLVHDCSNWQWILADTTNPLPKYKFIAE